MASNWTPTTFKARFTEFASVDDAKVQEALDEAAPEVSEAKWSQMYDRGLGYLAAHILKIRVTIESGDTELETLSPLSSKTIGDVSYAFSSGTLEWTSDEILKLSPYGREYFRLRRLRSFGGFAMTDVE